MEKMLLDLFGHKEPFLAKTSQVFLADYLSHGNLGDHYSKIPTW